MPNSVSSMRAEETLSAQRYGTDHTRVAVRVSVKEEFTPPFAVFRPDLESFLAPVWYLPEVNPWCAEVKRSTLCRAGLRRGEATPSFSAIQDHTLLRPSKGN